MDEISEEERIEYLKQAAAAADPIRKILEEKLDLDDEKVKRQEEEKISQVWDEYSIISDKWLEYDAKLNKILFKKTLAIVLSVTIIGIIVLWRLDFGYIGIL